MVGTSILAVVEAMGAFRSRAVQILEQQGVAHVERDRWYPLPSYLAALEVMALASPSVLTLTGRKLVDTNVFPPEIGTVDDALSSLDGEYQSRHRNAGSFEYRTLSPTAREVAIRTPYPCDLDRTVIERLAQRFPTATGGHARVTHESTCKKHGADHCVLSVRG